MNPKENLCNVELEHLKIKIQNMEMHVVSKADDRYAPSGRLTPVPFQPWANGNLSRRASYGLHPPNKSNPLPRIGSLILFSPSLLTVTFLNISLQWDHMHTLQLGTYSGLGMREPVLPTIYYPVSLIDRYIRNTPWAPSV